ncbi:NAD(P)-binding domain-containing protein [Kineococcus vitellinus]|uniref:NADPH-dependent F420 reductase n=1 Tax=Kineococcus vitellinus TaxID=2696565 RepID=UPI00196B38F6
MEIGIIGSGNVGRAFAGHLVRGGHEVVLSNNSGPESLRELVARLGGAARAGTVQEAAAQEVVVLAVPSAAASEVAASVPDWSGRILVDATNDFSAPVPGPGEPTSSEVLAGRARGARVVKTGNHMGAADLAAGSVRTDGNVVLFFSGDDADAKKVLAELFEALEFIVVDLGPLGTGSRLQQFPGGPLSGRAFVTLPL